MAQRKNSEKSGASLSGIQPELRTSPTGPIDQLTDSEAREVLLRLLDQRPDLRSVAERIAVEMSAPVSIEEIASTVYSRIAGADMNALNERAGAHSWGYVEPAEAAGEVLEDAIEDLVQDMHRKAELGHSASAAALCAGIVAGLYRARDIISDGALEWVPDFPEYKACDTYKDFLQTRTATLNKADLKRLHEELTARAPKWSELLRRIASIR